MTAAPSAASLAAWGSDASAARQSIPSGSPPGPRREAQRGQAGAERTPDLTGTEHHMKWIIAHGRAPLVAAPTFLLAACVARLRTPARSWKPAAAVPSRSTPDAMPVVTTSGVPDIVATRITGPMVSSHPTGR